MSLWSRLFRGRAAELYRRGIQLFNEGDYDGAVALLEQLVAGKRGSGSPLAKLGAFYAAEAHARLGVAEFHRGRFEKALGHFASALAENPHYPDLYYYAALCHHRLGERDEAIANLEKAISLNSEYAEAVCYLGIILHEAGYFEKASGCFERALQLSKLTRHPLGSVIIKQITASDFDHPALEQLRKAVEDNSCYRNLLHEATAAFNEGNLDLALDRFARAVDLKPDYPDLHCRLGLCYLEKGRHQEAARCLERALELNPDYVEALYYLASALFALGDYRGSLAKLERAVAKEPGYADLQCLLGTVLLALGELDRAQEALDRALEIAPEYAKAHYIRGLCWAAEGNLDEASADLKRALELNPSLDTALVDLAVVERGREGAPSSGDLLQDLLRRHNDRADLWCLMGRRKVEKGDWEEAERCFRQALAINNSYGEARKQLALVLYRRGRSDEAEVLIREALELKQNYPDLHKILGDILLRKGERSAARDAYRQSLAINPRYAGAAAGYILALRQMGRGREADAFLADFIEENPDHPLLRALLAADKLAVEEE